MLQTIYIGNCCKDKFSIELITKSNAGQKHHEKVFNKFENEISFLLCDSEGRTISDDI